MRAPSTPAGRRWKGVSSAPDSVVGIAATGAPVTPPIAFAVSITRPPPSATSGASPASGRSDAAISSTRPERHVNRRRRLERRASGRALGGQEGVFVEAALPEQIGRLGR